MKEEIELIKKLELLADDALNGGEYAEEVLVLAKQLETTAKNIKEKVMSEAIERIESFGGKREFEGFILSASKTSKYDYSNCQAWAIAKAEEEEYAKHRKSIEKEMQMMASSGQYEKKVTTSDGAEIQLTPAKKYVTDIVKVSFKK